MPCLGDFECVRGNLASISRAVVVALHKFVFENEGNRGKLLNLDYNTDNLFDHIYMNLLKNQLLCLKHTNDDDDALTTTMIMMLTTQWCRKTAKRRLQQIVL